ncbi:MULTISPECIES: sulfotransferase [unclassified Okeania]|nr:MULTISPECIES: sulfotransferase [unclassified Okeania]NES78362.1 sulfotransferase [Okeania sp. SIO1H4]NET12316.1 sulfotransferase [Okeania sp. SIO1H6]NET21701.1 sulfotransferase [Okeania sp. SIO1H5]NET95050.1 sulfotransferase [Okeania sp. SIO1H2]
MTEKIISRTLETPFFIVGCPRSGTTLLQIIIDAHPNIIIPR